MASAGGNCRNFFYVGNSTNLGSSTHSKKSVIQASSPGIDMLAHPLINKANTTAKIVFFKILPA